MRRFWTGFAISWAIDKTAWGIALSDTDMGRSVMARVLGRLSHDRFMVVKDAVNAENDRRSDSF